MELVQEITQWDSPVPNHIYLIASTGKCIAYKSAITHTWQAFKKPLSFDRKGRKFKKLDFDIMPDDIFMRDEKPQGREVQGSNGAVYYVNEGTCTCPAFKFRKTCKHL